MKERSDKSIIFIILAMMFLLVPLASAAYDLKNSSIQKNYGGGESIKGTINISFTNQPAYGTFTSNFNGSISLLDLLKNNSFTEGNGYSCTANGCGNSYSTKDAITNLALEAGAEKIIGFKVSGNDVEIQNLKISLTSSVADSCTSQIVVDVLDKNEILIQNSKYKTSVCSFNAGCFNSGLSNYDSAKITSIPYCENLTLPPGPAYYIGARVKNSTSGASNLKMKLYNSQWDFVGECNLPKNSQESENLKCIVNYSNVKTSSHFACIQTDSGASSDYMVRSEQEGQVCGTTDAGSTVFQRDYDIFAENLKFDTVDLVINESNFVKTSGTSLKQYADDYIQEVYNRNCTSGCVIPLALKGEAAQNVNFANVGVQYLSDGAILTNSQAYSLEMKNSELNSKGYLILNLEKAGFEIPVTSNENKFYLYLNGSSVLSSPINITPGFYFDVIPKDALLGINTVFQAVTSVNISSSTWKFGDGSSLQGNGSGAIHKYDKEGPYNLEVELTSKAGAKTSRKFSINVGNANESAILLINRYDARIKNISEQIKSYDLWIQEEIREKENITSLNSSLISLKKSYSEARNDTEYAEIVQKLGDINVPYSISSSESGKAPLAIGYNNIDTSYLEALSNHSELSEKSRENLKLQIIDWNEKHYSADMDYKVITAYHDSANQNLFTYVKIKLTKKNESKGQVYLIINYPKNEIKFMKNYGEISVDAGASSATAIPISGDETVELLAPEKIDISELGSYVSPEISEFSNLEDVSFVEKNTRPQSALLLYALLFIAFLAVYIGLQEWYKRHYESYLFKSKDELYNIINFMYNARISQLGDDEIKNKLAGFKWKGEQVSYAFKKLDGKRTGMFEIPIFRHWEQKKIKAEIAKRQQNTGDARFIKRPNL